MVPIGEKSFPWGPPAFTYTICVVRYHDTLNDCEQI